MLDYAQNVSILVLADHCCATQSEYELAIG